MRRIGMVLGNCISRACGRGGGDMTHLLLAVLTTTGVVSGAGVDETRQRSSREIVCKDWQQE